MKLIRSGRKFSFFVGSLFAFQKVPVAKVVAEFVVETHQVRLEFVRVVFESQANLEFRIGGIMVGCSARYKHFSNNVVIKLRLCASFHTFEKRN